MSIYAPSSAPRVQSSGFYSDPSSSRPLPSRYTVLGFGTPCTDSIVKVNETFLKRFGLEAQKWAQIFDWNQFSSLLSHAESISDKRAVQKIGGSASNTIKTLARLSNPTAFFGKLGHHPQNAFYRSSMENLGVKLLMRPSSRPMTQITAFVREEDGERFFRAFPDLSQNLSPSLLTKELFQGVKVAHFEGFMLKEFSLPFIKKAMAMAQEAGAVVSFDLGCEPIASEYSEEILDLLKNVDIVFANYEEARLLLRIDSEKEAGQILSSRRMAGLSEEGSFVEASNSKPDPMASRVCIIKKGDQGALVSLGKRQFSSPALQVEKVEDTDGAGDFFAAGFLHAYLKGCSLEACAKIGNLLGGSVVTQEGAEISEDRWPGIIDQIDHLIQADRAIGATPARDYSKMLKTSRKIDALFSHLTQAKLDKQKHILSGSSNIRHKNSYTHQLHITNKHINALQSLMNGLKKKLKKETPTGV